MATAAQQQAARAEGLPPNMAVVADDRPDTVRPYSEVADAVIRAVAQTDVMLYRKSGTGRHDHWVTAHRPDCGRAPTGYDARNARTLADAIGAAPLDLTHWTHDAKPGGYYRVCTCAKPQLAELRELGAEVKWAHHERQQEVKAERAKAQERADRERAERGHAAAERLRDWADQLGIDVGTIIDTVHEVHR